MAAVSYALILPLVAVLHVRDRRARWSGAILGTAAGTATVTIGLGASYAPDLVPAEALLRGMWWWTIGKLWAETGVLPRPLGVVTAGLGVVTVAGAVVAGIGGPQVQAAVAAFGRYVLALWLAALAAELGLRTPRRSP